MRGKSMRPMPVRMVWFMLPLLCSVTLASAAEIKVASGRGFSPVLDALAGEFERTTGNKVVVSYGPGHAIRDKIHKGDPADVVIIPRPLVEELAKENKVSLKA